MKATLIALDLLSILIVLVAHLLHMLQRARGKQSTGSPGDAGLIGEPPAFEQRLADALVDRIVNTRPIHRQIESITFSERTRLCRRLTFELDVPQAENDLRGTGGCIVPLTYVVKGSTATDVVLRRFDMRDGTGRRLPTLGGEQRLQAEFGVLARVIERDAGPQRRLTADELGQLWLVVTLPFERAKIQVRDLKERALQPGGGPSTLSAALQNDDGHTDLFLRLFAGYSLLFVDLGQSDQTGRAVVEVTFDDGTFMERQPRRWKPTSLPARGRNVAAAEAGGLSLRQQLSESADSLLRWLTFALGWTGARVEFKAWPTLPCRSHHLEVEAPEGLVLTEARSQMVTGIRREGIRRHLDGPVALDERLSPGATAGHVRLRDIEPRTFIAASIVIDSSRWDPRTLLAAGAALALSIGLWMGFARPASVRQPEVAATLFLFVPGLIASATVLVGHHDVIRGWRSLYRGLVIVVGVISLVAATSLVALPDPKAAASPETLKPVEPPVPADRSDVGALPTVPTVPTVPLTLWRALAIASSLIFLLLALAVRVTSRPTVRWTS